MARHQSGQTGSGKTFTITGGLAGSEFQKPRVSAGSPLQMCFFLKIEKRWMTCSRHDVSA